MLGRLKTFSVMMVAIFVVAAFTMPHVCLADGATGNNAIHADHQTDKSDHHGKNSKADNCCVAHHCCVAKAISQSPIIGVLPSISKIALMLPVSQNPTAHIPQGLERPPKFLI